MLSRSELTVEILEKAKSLGASTAGIADVASLKGSPSHTIYPKIGMNLHEDFDATKAVLPSADVSWPEDAVSAVVIGVEHSPDRPELDWWGGKGTPGNRILIRINRQLSQWVESRFGIRTYQLPYFVEKGGIFLKDADDLHLVEQFHGIAVFIPTSFFDRINDLETANTGNGTAQPDQLFPVQLIGPAEAVDDFWDGSFGLGMTHVVGEVVILGN